MAAREFTAHPHVDDDDLISDTISKVRAGDLTERVPLADIRITSLTGLRTTQQTIQRLGAYCKSVREFARGR
jgi:hypothetical protein